MRLPNIYFKRFISEDCGGVDYKEIYRVLMDSLNGEVPKDVNEATAEKILEMMSELRESAIGESYESFVRKRALVKYQSQSEVI